jgi:hypothetical protein
VRKSVFEVSDTTAARLIGAEAVRRGLRYEIEDGDAVRPRITITHREYERDAAEMIVRSVDPTAQRHLDTQ